MTHSFWGTLQPSCPGLSGASTNQGDFHPEPVQLVEQFLVPTPTPGDVVVMDNLSSPKGNAQTASKTPDALPNRTIAL